MAAGYLSMGRPSTAPSEGASASAGARGCVGNGESVRECARGCALVGRYSFLFHVLYLLARHQQKKKTNP